MKSLAECSILIVDDTEANVDILVETLGHDYQVAAALDGESALEIVHDSPPDLILLDIMMPGIDGYQVCLRLKQDPRTRDIPVIFITAMSEITSKTKGFEIGAVDYITKPFEPMEVKARVKTHLSLLLSSKELLLQNEILEDKVRERTRELALTQEATIESMAVLCEYRDPETGGHIKRTKGYMQIMADRVRFDPAFSGQFDPATLDLLSKSAPLHDIGKVGVPDNILLKPGKLTPGEFGVMKLHTTYGHEVLLEAEKKLGGNSFLSFARVIAHTHHENWDGTGYPRGIAGLEIPLPGRLMALADVYDALISKRVYKPPFPHAKAVTIIVEGAGSHFDPDLVRLFLDLSEDFRKIAIEYADFDEELLALSQIV